MDNIGDKGDKGQRQMTDKARVGKIGEDLACAYLAKQGYQIVCRNYWKPWGEIDVVAQKGNDLRFVEVKTVTRLRQGYGAARGDYEPEDNMHPWKRQRLRRVIETYLLAKEDEITDDTDWQVDAISVYIDREGRGLQVEWLEDIVL